MVKRIAPLPGPRLSFGMSLRFIPPASPRRRDRPPVGDRWIHEVKFDGYRIQVHKSDRDVALLSRKGHCFTWRFPDIAVLLRTLPAKAAIIDAELVACSAAGVPDFRKLHASQATSDELCLWAFDLLHLNGKDLLDVRSLSAAPSCRRSA